MKMREPNLNDSRLNMRPSLAAKRKLYAIAKRLGVPMDRVLEQLVHDAPADLKLTESSVVAEEIEEQPWSLAQASKKVQQKGESLKARSEALKARGKAKIEAAGKKKR